MNANARTRRFAFTLRRGFPCADENVGIVPVNKNLVHRAFRLDETVPSGRLASSDKEESGRAPSSKTDSFSRGAFEQRRKKLYADSRLAGFAIAAACAALADGIR